MLQSTPLDNIIIILIMVIITNPVVNKEGWPRAWQCSKHFTHVMLNHLVLTVTLKWVQLYPISVTRKRRHSKVRDWHR